MTVILETERLRVRTWELTDAEAALAIFGDPAVAAPLLMDPIPDLEQQRTMLQRQIEPHPVESGFGHWAVCELTTGQVVGGALLMPLDGGPDIEVGYHLRRDCWGRGYATEVTRALVSYGFRVLRLPQIFGVALPENLASQRVLQKSGLRPVGPRHVFGHDLSAFLITRTDFESEHDQPAR